MVEKESPRTAEAGAEVAICVVLGVIAYAFVQSAFFAIIFGLACYFAVYYYDKCKRLELKLRPNLNQPK